MIYFDDLLLLLKDDNYYLFIGNSYC